MNLCCFWEYLPMLHEVTSLQPHSEHTTCTLRHHATQCQQMLLKTPQLRFETIACYKLSCFFSTYNGSWYNHGKQILKK